MRGEGGGGPRPDQAGPFELCMDSDPDHNDGKPLKDYKQRSYLISFLNNSGYKRGKCSVGDRLEVGCVPVRR